MIHVDVCWSNDTYTRYIGSYYVRCQVNLTRNFVHKYQFQNQTAFFPNIKTMKLVQFKKKAPTACLQSSMTGELGAVIQFLERVYKSAFSFNQILCL